MKIFQPFGSRILLALGLQLLLATLAQAASLTLAVPPHINGLLSSTSATLTTLGRTYTAPLRRSNTFRFVDVSPGSYLLDVHCRDWAFAPLRVDVEVKEGAETVLVWQTFRGNEWDNKGEFHRERPVVLSALGYKEYYSKREGFSPLSLFGNPMILLAGVSMVIMFGMPYLLENMDPETRKEFEDTQAKSPLTGGGRTQNPLQGFDMAAWMAGSSPNAGPGASSGSEAKDSGQSSGGGRGGGGRSGTPRRR